eukprot:TRINITY_DN8696_c0_g1_i2.p2 TRINITY_DN8696_c0_g1~~TRINITY_DN8696_c0_g1_i2.p2  ORF type:complete len:107 (+),score=20.51 TRINITY_DN8696_c0_g1_i2:22-342(+)
MMHGPVQMAPAASAPPEPQPGSTPPPSSPSWLSSLTLLLSSSFTASRELTFILSTFAVYFFYLYYSIKQEQLSRVGYDGDTFSNVASLLFFQCLISAISGRAGTDA